MLLIVHIAYYELLYVDLRFESLDYYAELFPALAKVSLAKFTLGHGSSDMCDRMISDT